MSVDTNKLAQQIVDAALNSNGLTEIQPLKPGNDHKKNELIMFVKPEVFMDTESDKMKNAVEMMLGKLVDYDVDVNGVVLYDGKTLGDNEIMSRHYGFINQMSRFASQIVSDDDKKRVGELLSISDIDEYAFLGGHEFLERFSDLDSLELDSIWFEKPSSKVRSGFYIRDVNYGGEKVVLVNGFHPEQLGHFTKPDRRIALLLLHSDAAWELLRQNMIGETFPEKAIADSIRGTLYRSPQSYGFESVSIANNAVHLSAGAVEAVKELDNFAGSVLGVNIKEQHPNLIRELLKEGLSLEEAIEVLDNPNILLDNGDMSDLFSATEHKDLDEAVAIWAKSKKRS